MIDEPCINLALMMTPDDSPLATASYAERQAAMAPKPLAKKRIVIASTNPVKIGATRAAFADMYEGGAGFHFDSMNGISGVSDQPKTQAETRLGAENRARSVFDAYVDTLYSVGIEGGIEDGPDGMRSFAWVAVFNGEKMSFAQTAVFYLPQQIAELVRQGKELGEADDIVFGQNNSKQVNGAVGLLTGNAITRVEYYTQAVIMALIPFTNETLTWPSPAQPSKHLASKMPDPNQARDELLAKVKGLMDAIDEPYYAWLAADEKDNEPETKAYYAAAGDALGYAALYFELYVDADIKAPAFAKQKTVTEQDAAQQNTIAAFLDALKQAERTVTSPAHTLEHQEALTSLLAASKLLEQVFPGLARLPGPSEKISDEDLRDLRMKLAACETDLKMVRGMINIKNEEAQRQAVELRKAREDATQARDQLSEMILDRNRAQLAAVNAMLDKEELQAQAVPLHERGVIKSKRLFDPEDGQIESLRNEGWHVAFEQYALAAQADKHFIRFERLEAFPEPEREEDEAQAAAEAAVPQPFPSVLDLLFQPSELERPLVLNATYTPGPVTQRLMQGVSVDAIKAGMNQQAIAAGVQAATQHMQMLAESDGTSVLEPVGLTIDAARDPLDFEDGPDLF